MTAHVNPFDLETALSAERLVEAFDSQDGDQWAELFESADRQTLGALVLYASLAMRELAERDGTDLPTVRRVLRAGVTNAIAITFPNNGEHA